VTRCKACGEVYFTEESDERIVAALRDHLALLTPAQIRANLETLGLSQKEAAGRLGIAPETLSRWLCGAVIQSRAMDNLLRAFFACPQVREKLTGAEIDRAFGEKVEMGTSRI
jgi:DNA-binding transcriptional regulator YiaG